MITRAEFAPKEPATLEETGLPESAIEQLILKILYYRGDLYGQDLSAAIGLRFSVIEGLVESLKIKHHLQVKRSLGMGSVGAVLGLTESGRALTREMLETSQYAGAAPVPLDQYIEQVRAQRPAPGWLTKPSLTKALSSMVITEQILSQVGPAISSGNSMLVYGKPGDGKTYLIESLNNLDTAPVFVPHAIDCQGNIVRVFDPVYHERLDDDEEISIAAVGRGAAYDRRWVRCKRPFIVSGGELTLDMLDLRYNAGSKVYEAPFQ
jgi:predicted ATPase with chaperone activity